MQQAMGNLCPREPALSPPSCEVCVYLVLLAIHPPGTAQTGQPTRFRFLKKCPRCCQEEYGDPRTLEQRLQLVARRMVSNSGRGRPAQGSMPGNLPTANGFSATNPLAHAPNFSSGQPSFPQQQMPQQFAGPPTLGLLSAGSAGLGNLQTSAGVPSMHNQPSSGLMGNPMQGLRPLVGSPQVGGSNLSAASGLKLEQQGMSGLAMQVRKAL